MKKVASAEFKKFDGVVRHALSVSHEELRRREKEWRDKRKQKRASLSKGERP